ncbi:MAG: nitroreductase family protein [Patescibacteria group bacterium]|nr:nitroreductase family protein [Patescibacteria group bacterium]
MIDFWQTIKKRHSVRSFDSKKDVADKDLQKIIEAAKMAPSAGGIYPTDFIVVRDQKTKKQIAKAALGQYFISEAPLVIVVAVDVEKTASRYGERGRNLYVIQDSAAATENLILAATALGLGTCWVGAFDENEIAKILQLKQSFRPLAIIPVGYEKQLN